MIQLSSSGELKGVCQPVPKYLQPVELILTPLSSVWLQIEGGFASKAERRLASRLHSLLQVSVQPAKPNSPAVEPPTPTPAPPADKVHTS